MNKERKTSQNCLATLFPEIAKQLHPTKNGNLTPFDIAPYSSKKVWWVCDKGHEYDLSVSNRTVNKNGCPYCSGHRVCIDNCLATTHPKISKQWHPTKNGNLTPLDVSFGSNIKVWWVCDKGHEWETKIITRVGSGGKKGTNCPFCCNKKVCIDNSLESVCPEIAKEWHPTKNGNLKPTDVTIGTNKKVWWICSKGHEWKTSINHRTQKIGGTNCPYCVNQKVLKKDSFGISYPNIAKKWDYQKNGELTPYDVSCESRKKVWWVCTQGHSYYKTVYLQIKHDTCPICTNYYLRGTGENNLVEKASELVKYWHPTKNKDITPQNTSFCSHKKVWWKCPDCNYEWERKIMHQGNYCEKCRDREKIKDSNLKITHPEIAKQWHPTKNGDLTPLDVSFGTHKKVWWKCPDCNYEWKSIINSRTRINGRNCPKCNKERQTSFPEQAIYYYLSKIFTDVQNSYKNIELLGSSEIDVFISKYNIAIEYDGEGFHRKRENQDSYKNRILKENGIRIVRIREKGCPILTENPDYLIEYDRITNYKNLDLVIQNLFLYILNEYELTTEERKNIENINIDLKNDKNEILSSFLSNKKEKSIIYTHPHLVRYWHPTRNGKLTLEKITYGSGIPLWWKCPNCNNEFKKSPNEITNRSNKNKIICPKCIIKGKKLIEVWVESIEYWDFNKNTNIEIDAFTYGSTKEVHWKCPHCNHEWIRSIEKQCNIKKCPKCKNKSIDI